MKPLQEPKVIRTFLEKDRPYAVLALTCLEPEWRAYSRFYMDGSREAAVWVFEHPQLGTVLQTFGETSGVEALLSKADLPRGPVITIKREHFTVAASHYAMNGAVAEWLMHVTPQSYRRLESSGMARQLGRADAGDMAALYAPWDESHFEASRLDRGWVYYGIRQQGQLVAVAGNEVRSKEAGVAKVIGVYVHPDWRGKGLGKAITAGITEALFALGARDVILHVREDNARAIATYERLGYRRHCRVFTTR